MKISQLQARSILDSRGNPTVEVDCQLEDGSLGRAAVPSGASTGSREALELRDQDPKHYLGKGVAKAVSNVNSPLREALLGQDFSQTTLDQKMIELDGTDNKEKLGANALLGVSMAFAKAQSVAQNRPLFENLAPTDRYSLPVPMMNVINGGAHADNGLDFQEFMLMPFGFEDFSSALRAGAEIFQVLKSTLKKKGLSTNVGDEGGFAPAINEVEECMEILLESIEKAGYNTESQISLALDVASSEFFVDGKYASQKSSKFSKSSQEMIRWYESLVDQYPLSSIEDPLAEGDWPAWTDLTQALGDRVQIVGDDLFVTNPSILKEGIEKKSANAILIKLNQIGTVTETLEAIALAQEHQFGVVISHRSGETEDTFIADLSVGTAAGQIKTGSLSRSDRVAKYNQLLRIEELLSPGSYAGKKA